MVVLSLMPSPFGENGFGEAEIDESVGALAAIAGGTPDLIGKLMLIDKNDDINSIRASDVASAVFFMPDKPPNVADIYNRSSVRRRLSAEKTLFFLNLIKRAKSIDRAFLLLTDKFLVRIEQLQVDKFRVVLGKYLWSCDYVI